MMTFSVLETEHQRGAVEQAVPIHRYAWLEYEGGAWCFLTNLFADPEKSMRKWTDEKNALQELENEGWIVVYPYNEQIPPCRQLRERACGYGLMWIDPAMVS
ncbi:MAG: hypothetical protein JW793_13670 [Acidobacteria bacterium]|nr:hypothetical protein [Acidobacteriota bacterium]